MGDLDADDREKIPTKDFGLPEKARTKDAKKESGNYPMPDKRHARNAKARASQQRKAGRLTQGRAGADRPQGRQDPRQLTLGQRAATDAAPSPRTRETTADVAWD